MTLTFNLLRAMVMACSQAKVQGQWSVDSEDRVEINGRMDTSVHWTEVSALPSMLMQTVTNADGNNHKFTFKMYRDIFYNQKALINNKYDLMTLFVQSFSIQSKITL